MSEYDKAEQEGRQYFHQLFPKYTKDYSKDKFSFWDVSGYTVSNEIADVPYVAELKKRGCEHDYYDTVMLEVSKYDALKSYTVQSGIKTFYVNIFSDKSLIFNIDNINLSNVVRESKMLPATSAEDKGYKLKEVLYLPITDAKILSRGYKKLKTKNGK